MLTKLIADEKAEQQNSLSLLVRLQNKVTLENSLEVSWQAEHSLTIQLPMVFLGIYPTNFGNLCIDIHTHT